MGTFLIRAALVCAAVLSGGVCDAPAWADGPGPSVLQAEPLVRAVLDRNQGIAALEATVAAAAARTETAGALADPMVSYAAAPHTAGWPGRGLNENLQISQTIPWPGTLGLRVDAARAEMDSSRYRLDDLRLRLTAETRTAYAEWYYVHRAIGINGENRALVGRLRKVAEGAYAAGQASQQDVLQAQVELVRLQNQALELERQRKVVQSRINRLLNQEADTPLAPPGGLPRPQPLPAPDRLRQMAFERHPVLLSLRAQSVAASDRAALAEKGRYPNFTVMAGYNSLLDAPEKRFAVGVGVNIPFGGNHRGQIAEADARSREVRARLGDSSASLASDLEQAYAGAEQADETIGLYTGQLLPLARQNREAAEADYRNGHGDFLKLIVAEQQELAARLELLRAQADRFRQSAALDYGTGGGLSGSSDQEVSP